VRILVTGSRDWTTEAVIRHALDRHAVARRFLREDIETVVMHGNCRGADQVAAKHAFQLGFMVEAYPADWAKHGKAAGPIRNREMLDRQPDLVLAFQRNGSRGTQDVIDEAKRRGIPVELYAV
jgi:hypothetical protein